MKNLSLLFALIPFIAFSKTRLEDYYFGFEIATVVSHDYIDGETFDLSTNIPLENSSVQLNLMFANTEASVLGVDVDMDGLEIGADYLYHFNNFNGFIPFAGVGLNYTETTLGFGGVTEDLDDVFWNIHLGLEFSVSDQFSILPRLRIHQGFDDITDGVEVEAGIALTYWINDSHGLSLNYANNYLGDVDFLGLQYLYSWE